MGWVDLLHVLCGIQARGERRVRRSGQEVWVRLVPPLRPDLPAVPPTGLSRMQTGLPFLGPLPSLRDFSTSQGEAAVTL